MVSMNDANVKYGTRYGQQYFEKGSKEPYTGWLYARYDNGELETAQQFKDGVGNGIWINYDPDGRRNHKAPTLITKQKVPQHYFMKTEVSKQKGIMSIGETQ